MHKAWNELKVYEYQEKKCHATDAFILIGFLVEKNITKTNNYFSSVSLIILYLIKDISTILMAIRLHNW